MHHLPAASPRYQATLTLAALVLTAMSAGAQVGTAVLPLNVQGDPATAYIGFSTRTQLETGELLGGVTLFASHSPNGPLLARLPFLPPFEYDPDVAIPPPWRFDGVPPATYYIALVYGVLDAPTIPDAAWTPLVVPGACTGAPGMGLVDRDVAGVEPNEVRLFLSTIGGCTTSFLFEAGTSPGATDVASLAQSGQFLSAGGVPPGSYYVRVRGRNQFGIGDYSAVLPVSVPACVARPMEVSDFRATVVGNHVTLTWTPPALPPGRPTTYYELDVRTPTGGAITRILLPAVSSVSGSVAPGSYALELYAGNACSMESVGAVLVTVP